MKEQRDLQIIWSDIQQDHQNQTWSWAGANEVEVIWFSCILNSRWNQEKNIAAVFKLTLVMVINLMCKQNRQGQQK